MIPLMEARSVHFGLVGWEISLLWQVSRAFGKM
jgi:hypothetical protein